MLKRIFKKRLKQMKKTQPFSGRQKFVNQLNSIKKDLEGSVHFYPHSILGNLTHLDNLLFDINLIAEDVLTSGTVNDIGGADGDIAFYCEFLGVRKINLIDHAPTNFNSLTGAIKLKEALNSNINIIDIDLNSPNGWESVEEAETTLLLGTLYHLQNPFLALYELSTRSKYLLLSTKVFDVLDGKNISSSSSAYFYFAGECNNDPTNWWCFTDECLKRVISRSGWEIISYKRIGCENNADPVDNKKDGRAFAYLKSKVLI